MQHEKISICFEVAQKSINTVLAPKQRGAEQLAPLLTLKDGQIVRVPDGVILQNVRRLEGRSVQAVLPKLRVAIPEIGIRELIRDRIFHIGWFEAARLVARTAAAHPAAIE